MQLMRLLNLLVGLQRKIRKKIFSKKFGVCLFIFVSQLERISTEFSLVFATSVDSGGSRIYVFL